MRRIDDPRRRLLLAAIGAANEGDQCRHTFLPMEEEREAAPRCFQKEGLWAHLFDQDAERLRATAWRLGVRRVFIHRPCEPGQHVDLCGKPLGLAVLDAEEVRDEAELDRLMHLGAEAFGRQLNEERRRKACTRS
ncbi:MAG TPA: hypothetical protein VMY69_05225 [Phycisphaerae bacterium]|nr:hypothetical protein [Phycisphaerae bacterium]